MTLFLHLLGGYFRRFRWELAAWWLVTLTASVMALSGLRFEALTGAARVEIIAALWVILRLALADEAFGTLAGRETRPLSWGAILLARLALAVVAFLPPLLLRVLVWSHWVSPDAADLKLYLSGELVPNVARFVFLAALLQGIAWLMRLRAAASGRLAHATLLALGGLATLWVAGKWLRETRSDGFMRGRQSGGAVITSALRALLPPRAVILGQSDHGMSPPWALREVLRMPLTVGATLEPSPGARLTLTSVAERSARLEVGFSLRGLPGKTARQAGMLERPVAVIRFGDDQYGMIVEFRTEALRSPLALSPLEETRFTGIFESPISLPWNLRDWPELLAGAEILFFAPTGDPLPPPPRGVLQWLETEVTSTGSVDLPPFGIMSTRSSSQGSRTTIRTPIIPAEEEAGLEAQVRACMELLSGGYNNKDDATLLALLEGKGARVISPLLSWPAWSERQWTGLVRPLLVQHAGENDLPALEKRLAHDPRLASLFEEKGWAAAALPHLRRFAKERRPLDAAALVMLARLQDPELAPDLAALAMRLREGLDDLAPLLRDHPGFDWPAFIEAGWQSRKYSERGGGWFAVWAAGQGDPSAFRHLAVRAARGGRWELGQLPALVDGEHADLIGHLRANIDRMIFDPAIRKFRLP